MLPIELGGVLRSLTEHKECDERQPDTDRADYANGNSLYRSRFHWYQSLCNCHWLRQKNRMRNGAGY